MKVHEPGMTVRHEHLGNILVDGMKDLESDSAILPGAAVLVETAGPRVYRRGVVSVVGAEDITVSFSTGEEQCARMSVWPANDFTHFAEDATTLLHLSEATLLENVRIGFAQAHIYMWVGPVLVAVNPMRPLPKLYDDAAMLAATEPRR